MPSYRLTLTVGQIRGAIAPPDVQPEVGSAVASHATVEANEIKISNGAPQLVIRYTATDPAHAREVVELSLAQIDAVIEVVSFRVTSRQGTRWLPI